ncbi:MAG: fatty-acyl-CoA synthase [Paraglaciecola sp.]|jgi:fatty-acyl-CoA synthase
MLTESYVMGPETPTVKDITVGELLKIAAQECPQRVAMIAGVNDPSERRQWTYAELYADSLMVARAILQKFKPGEHIAVMAPNIPEWLLVQFGSALAGTVLVTVNPAYRPDEIAYVLKQSESAGIFVLPEFRGNEMLASIKQVSPQCPDLREIIQFDQWDAFMSLSQNDTITLPDVKPSDAVMIQYTSGTTGFPKGVLLHHRGLVNNGYHTQDRMGVEEGSVWMTTMPLFHTGGCVACVLGAVGKKTTQVLVEAFEPGRVLELVETYSANSMVGVPTMLIAMLEHPEFANRDLSTLSNVCSGGSLVPADVVKLFEDKLGVNFTIVFGQTESSPVSSMTRPDDTTDDKANTIGGPMPNVELKIVDPDTGATVPLNTLGEYLTRGYHIMNGYFNMAEATAKTIDEDGWLHTGDLCSMDERGYCKVEGRLKDMIIRGGENIYPREIENLLFKHPTVGEVAVVGLPDDRLGEVVAAFIRPAPDKKIDKNELFSLLRKHLSPQKTPTHWFSVSSFPLTGSGKIQKFSLRKQWEAGELSEI